MSLVSTSSVGSSLERLHGLNQIPLSTVAGRTELNSILSNLVNYIWRNGLDSGRVDELIATFVNNDLDGITRKVILDCLVPQEKLSPEALDSMILWVTGNCVSSPEGSLNTLRWMKVMVRYGFVEPVMFDGWYNMLIKYFAHPKLAEPLSEILCIAAHPKFMTKCNARLLEKKYEDSDDECPYIKRMLWEYAQHVPHLVSKHFHFQKPSAWDSVPLTEFEKAVKARGRVRDVELPSQGHVLCPDIPIEYDEDPKSTNLKKIGEVGSMMELGRSLDKLKLPTNELSLLQSEEGIMLIIVNKPSLNFLQSLDSALTGTPSDTLIVGVSGLQELLTYGLPPVTNFLSRFLKVWDGTYKSEYVYCLLSRLYFDTFEDLNEHILCPLVRVFVTEGADTKVKILDTLLYLITNVVTCDMRSGSDRYGEFISAPKWLEYGEGTVASLIECVSNLWLHAIALEGPQCTRLILHCLLFYRKINSLILKFNLPLFFIISPSYSSSALLSNNLVVLEELCKLILSYKRDVIPVLERQGLLGEFEVEMEAVMAMADSTFKYIWERVGGERPANFHTTQDEFTPLESIGMEHMALYPFVSHIAKELGKTLKRLNRNEVMTLLDNFVEGVAEFIRYEENDQLKSMN